MSGERKDYEVSDHKKNAEWLLRRASHYRDHGEIETAKACAQAAQAEATLALVEQQRVANLIALGQFRVGVDDLPHLRHLVIEPVNEIDVAPTEEICAVLGIERPEKREPRSDRDRAWDGAMDGGRLG